MRHFQQCLINPLHILFSDTEILPKKKKGEEEHFFGNSTESLTAVGKKMAEEEREWGRIMQVDEEISFTRRCTNTTDTFAFDIEEDNMENNDAEGNDTDGDEADEDDTDEDDREEDDTDEDNAEDDETEEDDAENEDSDDEEEISFPRRNATPAARSGTKAASGLRTL